MVDCCRRFWNPAKFGTRIDKHFCVDFRGSITQTTLETTGRFSVVPVVRAPSMRIHGGNGYRAIYVITSGYHTNEFLCLACDLFCIFHCNNCGSPGNGPQTTESIGTTEHRLHMNTFGHCLSVSEIRLAKMPNNWQSIFSRSIDRVCRSYN